MFRQGARKPQSGADSPLFGGFGATEAGRGWHQGSLLPAVHSHWHTRTRAQAAQGVAPAWDLQNLALGPFPKASGAVPGLLPPDQRAGFSIF